MNRRLTLALAVLASLAPAIALGLGLGDIRLHSALNQPLDAEIDLLAATDDEINGIKVRLASSDQFDRYGIDRVAALTSFKFEVVKRPDGRAYIHVTSDQAMREPFLTFLVEASWPRGRLLREYTVLLDPPVLAPAPQDDGYQEQAAPTVAAEPYAAPVTASEPTAQPAQPYVAPEPTTAPVIATPVAAAPSSAPSAVPADQTQPGFAEPADAAPVQDASNYGPVRRGETLWGIATQLKPEQRISMNQMMIAVYRANPDAFRGNINRLKRGAILRIPDAAEITAISIAEANAEAIRHNDEWQATRVEVAGAPSADGAGVSAPEPQPQPEPEPAPAPVAAAPVQAPVAEPTPAPAASAPTAAAPSDAGLAIVAPSDDLGAPSTDPAARVADLEKQLEEAKAAGTGTKRKRDRIARLEKELADARAALTVSSDTLAQLQDQAAAPSTAAPIAAPATTPATTPAIEPTTTEPAPVAAPSRPKKGMFDTLLENLFNPIVLGLLALAVLVPVGAIGFKKLKAAQAARKAAQAELAPWGEESEDADKTVVGGDEPTLQASRTAVPDVSAEEPTVMRGPDPALLKATGETVAIPQEQVEKTVMLPRDELDKTIMQTMAVPPPAPPAPAMDAAFEPAAVPQAETVVGGTPLKLDENDPMSEADFHMAYGLYDQAADLIKKASQREPARRDLRLKLLEIYFSAGNKGAFVSEAKALRESMGPRPDADWNNVVIFGKQIAPEEGMFNEMASATAAVDFDASAAGGATTANADLAFDPFAAPEPVAAAEPSLELPAAAPAPAPAAAAPVVDVPLEFELGDFELDAAAKPAVAPAAPPAPTRKAHTDSQSDFDKALAELSAFVDTNVPKVEGGDAPAAGGDLDLGEIQLDDGALEVEDESAASEIDTKLDLARAYIDMMDPGSAKGILEEVLADGDDKQKAEAEKLLKQLG